VIDIRIAADDGSLTASTHGRLSEIGRSMAAETTSLTRPSDIWREPDVIMVAG
jgi:hypothetical protein